MKYLFNLSILIAFTLTACSKKSGDVPPKNSVNINGTQYPTVTIGSQTWTTVNYNGPGGINYDNEANNPVYGKLYTFAEAQAIQLPAGWRLPTKDDFNKLIGVLGSPAIPSEITSLVDENVTKSLLSTSTWTYKSGTNSSGFNLVSAGFYSNFYGKTVNKGDRTAFYTQTLFNVGGNIPYVVSVYEYPNEVDMAFDTSTFGKDDRLSIRLVKDN
ncbi:FISUMP domain-containing protein [Mucilaginibacter ginsenosidivorans]|uniref:Fibrobacter succinogenes major paralogous domain-containing protein n=1 Tax=Mucilaginibacter ginsenosidivorans TaxID=398053 RepID=A0A5B8UUB0_9SPHI|nr:FISUMP domain-containing protein [Mucilaginibacter ginsenosidivorans]QEC62697.1 hypothetical protein FRZ54_08895 [Mucilaginibacter ginsenosidivorans]